MYDAKADIWLAALPHWRGEIRGDLARFDFHIPRLGSYPPTTVLAD